MANEGKVKIGVNADTGEDIFRDMTAEELAGMDTPEQLIEKKLNRIKVIRLEKLQETDYLANSDMTMPDNIITWRQSLRDIPQNNTTEEQYDLLLARVGGELTHAIWNKPE
tara:strand:+ start:378 stop:710 length:333 start_codon:yes stop_codon:yes gene_type:complete